MDTKLSVALLSGISLFMSLGAFAVSGDSDDKLNWSYAMGGSVQAESSDFDELAQAVSSDTSVKGITCTEGCPGRPQKALTLTYEDEAMPLADRVDTIPTGKGAASSGPISVRDKMAKGSNLPPQPTFHETQNLTASVPQGKGSYAGGQETFWSQTPQQPSQIETRYVESDPKVQFPITRQYPISVQYPITVQRNMTVEQPVVMQQPVIVRRPVVVQQDVTVRRQPTVIQQQPMIMQQQPSFIQQQPMYVQAPAAPMSPETLNSLNGLLAQPQPYAPQPQMMPLPPQPAMSPQPMQAMPSMQPADMQMPMMQNAYMPYPQQYQVQGQIQAQPIYTTMPPLFVQAPTVQQTMGMPQQAPAY